MDHRTERVSPPVAHARKNADGFWYVAVTWGNGRKELLGPYKTEAVALELIKAQLAAWHGGQKLFLKEQLAVRKSRLRWTDEDVRRLRLFADASASVDTIAKSLGRT